MHPAQSSRLAKEKNPENWCEDPKCLWNTRRSGPCPNHKTCDNCGERKFYLAPVVIVEPDGSRTSVNICTTCKAAELPEGWAMEISA
jgi:hypothetical protein